MSDARSGPREDAPGDGPYRLGGLVAVSWRFYAARFAPMFIIFLITNGVIAAMPFLIFVDLSDTASRIIGSLLGTLLAVFLSLGFGLSAAILERYLRDEYAGPRTAWREQASARQVSPFIDITYGREGVCPRVHERGASPSI